MKINKLSAVALALLMATSYGVVRTNNHKIIQAESHTSYVIDVENTSARVGFTDYVFVGEVVEFIGTEYRHHLLSDKGKVIPGTGAPYTGYKVKVIDNIKGDLDVNKEITVYQSGGVLESGKLIEVYEGDQLMQAGNTYIIETCVQPDGTLLASGANCNTQLDVRTKADLSKNQQYLSYLEDANNEIPYERERDEIVE